MSSSVDTGTENFAHYGYEKFRIVSNASVPNPFNVSDTEQFGKELEYAGAVDLNLLDVKLRNLSRQSPITPPPDCEATFAQARELEDEARRALLEAGCPPCYPSELPLPLHDLPQEYEVVSYWQSLPGTGRVVLQAQLANWRASCDYQRRNREYHVPRGTFSTFLEQVRNRRCRHGLQGEVDLLPDLGHQSRLHNWTEFQDYHLELHERYELEMKQDVEKLNTVSNRWRPTEGVTSNMSILEGRVTYGKHKLHEHDKMLRWIEQQRRTLVMEHPATVATARHPYSTRPSPARRKRNQSSKPHRSAVSKKLSQPRAHLRAGKSAASRLAADANAKPRMLEEHEAMADVKGTPSRRVDPPRQPLHRHSLRVTSAKTIHTENPQQDLHIPIKPTRRRFDPTAGRSNSRQAPKPFPTQITKTRFGREVKRPIRLGFE